MAKWVVVVCFENGSKVTYECCIIVKLIANRNALFSLYTMSNHLLINSKTCACVCAWLGSLADLLNLSSFVATSPWMPVAVSAV